MTAYLVRNTKQIIHQIDAVRCDVVQRPPARAFWICEPGPMAVYRIEPVMRRGLGEDRSADSATLDQFLGATHLRVQPAVICDAKCPAGLTSGLLHGTCF